MESLYLGMQPSRWTSKLFLSLYLGDSSWGTGIGARNCPAPSLNLVSVPRPYTIFTDIHCNGEHLRILVRLRRDIRYPASIIAKTLRYAICDMACEHDTTASDTAGRLAVTSFFRFSGFFAARRRSPNNVELVQRIGAQRLEDMSHAY